MGLVDELVANKAQLLTRAEVSNGGLIIYVAGAADAG
jgi:hypothetical protein